MNSLLLIFISAVAAASSDTISISYDTSQWLTSVLGSAVQASESPIGSEGSSAIDAIIRSLSALSETGDSSTSDVVSETNDAAETSSSETVASETNSSETSESNSTKSRNESNSAGSAKSSTAERSESTTASSSGESSETSSSTTTSNVGATLGCGSVISLLVLALI